MIEVVWKEADSDQLTRYKVLYPITTPMMPRPPHVTDSKYPNKLGCVYIRKFFAHWSLLHRYCAWGTGLWCAFGYLPSWCDADEHDLCHCCTDCCRSQCKRLQCPRETLPPWLQRLQSSSALLWLCGPEECMSTHFPQVFVKCFLFSCPCPPPSIKALISILQNPDREFTTYTLPLSFGLVVLPEQSPFSHPAVLEATLHDVGMVALPLPHLTWVLSWSILRNCVLVLLQCSLS